MEATKKRTRNVPIPEELHRKLKIEAYAAGVTLSRYVESHMLEAMKLRANGRAKRIGGAA